MTKHLVTWSLLAAAVLAASCSVWVDSKLKRHSPDDDGGMGVDGGMVVAECTTDTECDDLNPCNGVEMCKLETSMCASGMAATDGTTCMRPTRPGVCLTGTCVACIRDEDCDNNFSCDGIETCTIATHSCQSGTLPPAMAPCDTPTIAGGLCANMMSCCDTTQCCDAADTCTMR